jgi:ADP-heptose:LPS heptosyltransferase
MKTMWVVAASNSQRQNCWGYSLSTIKEPLASLVCGRHLHSPITDHSIERLRHLFAAALSYSADGPTRGLEQLLVIEHSREILFLHGTSRPEKLWPTDHWIGLGKQMTQMGYKIVIPAGSEFEAERAKTLASAIGSDAIVLEQLSVADISNRIRRAAGVVGVDSGLMHLAVALSRPTVAVMTADHQLKFLAKRFAPFWAEHAAVVIPHQAGADITPAMVFAAWQGLDQQPKIRGALSE